MKYVWGKLSCTCSWNLCGSCTWSVLLVQFMYANVWCPFYTISHALHFIHTFTKPSNKWLSVFISTVWIYIFLTSCLHFAHSSRNWFLYELYFLFCGKIDVIIFWLQPKNFGYILFCFCAYVIFFKLTYKSTVFFQKFHFILIFLSIISMRVCSS